MTRNMFLSRVLTGLGLMLGFSSGVFAQGIDDDDQFASLLAKAHIGALNRSGNPHPEQVYSAIWFVPTTSTPLITAMENYAEKNFKITQTGHESSPFRIGLWNDSFTIVNLKINIAVRVAANPYTISTAKVNIENVSVNATTDGGPLSESIDVSIEDMASNTKQYLTGGYDLKISKKKNVEEPPI